VQLKIHPALATILIAGIIILIFALIKGCSNNRQVIAVNQELKTKNDSLQKRITKDSIQFSDNKKEYKISLELANWQVEIRDNQLAKTSVELDAANKRINILLDKHKEITPDSDTSHTYVPNDFIVDCNGCFTELENGQKLVQQYRLDNEQLKFSLRVKDKLQTDRIGQQEQEKAKLSKSLQDCMEISKKAQNASAPKGQLYFSWDVLWNPWPSSAGVGLMYQTKYRVQYGATWYYGRYGQMIQTQMNLPLSIKRKMF
jgi:hypothetical protein